MNILLAYNHTSWQKAHYSHEKYFEALGHPVVSIPSEQTAYWTDFYNRLPFYFPKGIPLSVQSVEKKTGKKFDLTIEIDGAGQHHCTGMRSIDVPKVLWTIDTHLPVKRRFHLYFEEDFDHIFFSQKDYMRYFKKKACHWLPLACDSNFHRKLDLPKIYDVVFVGNTEPQRYPQRVRLLQLLSKKYNVKVFSSVYGDEMVRIFNQAKIVFNKSYNGDLNMRIFEVMSCGTMLVTDRTSNGLLDLFQDGKHLVTYENDQELMERMGYYLAQDQQREAIAQCGREEVLAKHTFYHRAKKILETIKHSENQQPDD